MIWAFSGRYQAVLATFFPAMVIAGSFGQLLIL